MDSDVERAVAIAGEIDRDAAPAFLEAAVRAADEAQSWEEFRDAVDAAGVDARVLREFAERVEAEFPDPWEIVARFGRHRADELVAALGPVPGADGADGPAEERAQDLAGFVAFLGENEYSWQQTWPESREWVVYTAGDRGFSVELSSFVEYVEATSLNDALAAYGVVAAAADVDASGAAEAPTPEQAAADAMALGRRAVEELRAQFPDLQVSDEQLARILDRELSGAGDASG